MNGNIDDIRPGYPCFIRPDHIFKDRRGIFMSLSKENELIDSGAIPKDFRFIQLNCSHSVPYTIRGMHYQTRSQQGKLMFCLMGSIFWVAVDVREGSPTFGKWTARHLFGDQGEAIYVPPGFANGFMAMDQGATVVYQMTDYYQPEKERSLFWRDPEVGITWPIGPGAMLNISQKDRDAPRLDAIERWRPPEK